MKKLAWQRVKRGGNRGFSDDGGLLRLGLQAYALGIAYEFDPYFGLSISRVDPLPHQLEASLATVKDPASRPWQPVQKVQHFTLSTGSLR